MNATDVENTVVQYCSGLYNREYMLGIDGNASISLDEKNAVRDDGKASVAELRGRET